MKIIILSTFFASIVSIILFATPSENKKQQMQICNHKQLDSLFANTYFVSRKDFKLMRIVRMDTTKCDTIKISF